MAVSGYSTSGTHDEPRRNEQPAPTAPCAAAPRPGVPRRAPEARPPARRRSAPVPAASATIGGPALVHVVAWPDPVVDGVGYDPRSQYVETFWLAVLGPTSTWLLRRLVAGLDRQPRGFDLDLDDTARALGLGAKAGRHSPLGRAMARCVTFGMARDQAEGGLAVRRRLPPLPRRHLTRLPSSLQAEHAQWMDASRRTSPFEQLRQRSRRLALGLLELEGDSHAVEVHLVRWRVHPAIAHEAVQWARTLRAQASTGHGALGDADGAARDAAWRASGGSGAVRRAGGAAEAKEGPPPKGPSQQPHNPPGRQHAPQAPLVGTL